MAQASADSRICCTRLADTPRARPSARRVTPAAVACRRALRYSARAHAQRASASVATRRYRRALKRVVADVDRLARKTPGPGRGSAEPPPSSRVAVRFLRHGSETAGASMRPVRQTPPRVSSRRICADQGPCRTGLRRFIGLASRPMRETHAARGSVWRQPPNAIESHRCHSPARGACAEAAADNRPSCPTARAFPAAGDPAGTRRRSQTRTHAAGAAL